MNGSMIWRELHCQLILQNFLFSWKNSWSNSIGPPVRFHFQGSNFHFRILQTIFWSSFIPVYFSSNWMNILSHFSCRVSYLSLQRMLFKCNLVRFTLERNYIKLNVSKFIRISVRTIWHVRIPKNLI